MNDLSYARPMRHGQVCIRYQPPKAVQPRASMPSVLRKQHTRETILRQTAAHEGLTAEQRHNMDVTMTDTANQGPIAPASSDKPAPAGKSLRKKRISSFS
jgi:hypothetical protein